MPKRYVPKHKTRKSSARDLAKQYARLPIEEQELFMSTIIARQERETTSNRLDKLEGIVGAATLGAGVGTTSGLVAGLLLGSLAAPGVGALVGATIGGIAGSIMPVGKKAASDSHYDNTSGKP